LTTLNMGELAKTEGFFKLVPRYLVNLEVVPRKADNLAPGSTVKSGLRRNKILAGVEIDRITSGIDPHR
jgi:hypothetical protein